MVGSKGEGIEPLEWGDDVRVVLGRVQNYLATMPPEERRQCIKGMVVKSSQQFACCDAVSGLVRLEE